MGLSLISIKVQSDSTHFSSTLLLHGSLLFPQPCGQLLFVSSILACKLGTEVKVGNGQLPFCHLSITCFYSEIGDK